jgi:hypothetical protein
VLTPGVGDAVSSSAVGESGLLVSGGGAALNDDAFLRPRRRGFSFAADDIATMFANCSATDRRGGELVNTLPFVPLIVLGGEASAERRDDVLVGDGAAALFGASRRPPERVALREFTMVIG